MKNASSYRNALTTTRNSVFFSSQCYQHVGEKKQFMRIYDKFIGCVSNESLVNLVLLTWKFSFYLKIHWRQFFQEQSIVQVCNMNMVCYRFLSTKFIVVLIDAIANQRDLNLSKMILVFFHWISQFYFNQRFCMAQSAVISNIIWTSMLIKKHTRRTEKTITMNCSLSIHWHSSKDFLSKLIERALKSDITNYIWSSEWMCAYFTEIKLTTQINKWYLSEQLNEKCCAQQQQQRHRRWFSDCMYLWFAMNPKGFNTNDEKKLKITHTHHQQQAP